MRTLVLAVVSSLVLSTSLGCGDDDKNGGNGGDDVSKACNVIVKQCDAESKGFTMDECLTSMKENSVTCVECVLGLTEPCKLDGSNPNYVKICHDTSKNCELK
jgi:hypothetical protein